MKWLIQGVREDGAKFRPSDWVERLAAQVAGFGPDHRLRYSVDIRPGFVNGEMCLMVDERLKQENPDAFKWVFDFASTNRLVVQQL